MTFKLNHELLGGHVHIAVFSGVDRDHLGKCGDLVMRAEEWDEFGFLLDKVNDNFKPEDHPFIFEDKAPRQPDASEEVRTVRNHGIEMS